MGNRHQLSSRIAFFISSMSGGGAQRGVLKTACGMAERGYQIDLVLAKAEGPYMAEVSSLVKLIDLKAPSVSASLPALVAYLRRERPQALLSNLSYVNVIALLATRLAGLPLQSVAVEHNTVSISSQKYLRQRGRLFVPRLVKWTYRSASDLVGVSQGVSKDLAAFLGISPQAVHVIHNPVITPDMQAKAAAPVDHAWFKPDAPPVVLAVGRLQHQKDFPTLIHAFANVRAKMVARLMILGEGPDRDKLEEYISFLHLAKDVSLPGFNLNPYAYMSKASAFVLSSRWEGLPTVLIEALYCGTPVVATNCPSGPDEILDHGTYGRLVPVGDVHAIADGISAALTGQLKRPRTDSWQRYEVNRVIEGYIKLLNL